MLQIRIILGLFLILFPATLFSSASWIFKNERFEHKNLVVLPIHAEWKEDHQVFHQDFRKITNKITNSHEATYETFKYAVKYILIKNSLKTNLTYYSGFNLIELFSKPKARKGDYHEKTMSAFFLNLPPGEYFVSQLSGTYHETKEFTNTNQEPYTVRETVSKLCEFSGPSPIQFSIRENDFLVLKPVVLNMNLAILKSQTPMGKALIVDGCLENRDENGKQVPAWETLVLSNLQRGS